MSPALLLSLILFSGERHSFKQTLPTASASFLPLLFFESHADCELFLAGSSCSAGSAVWDSLAPTFSVSHSGGFAPLPTRRLGPHELRGSVVCDSGSSDLPLRESSPDKAVSAAETNQTESHPRHRCVQVESGPSGWVQRERLHVRVPREYPPQRFRRQNGSLHQPTLGLPHRKVSS